jgi:hypothetical protein
MECNICIAYDNKRFLSRLRNVIKLALHWSEDALRKHEQEEKDILKTHILIFYLR